MKKIFTSLAIVTGLSVLVSAAVQPPLDLRGNSLATIDFVGGKACVVNAGAGNTTGKSCMTGRGEVIGYTSYGDGGTNFMVLWDSANAVPQTVTATSFTVTASSVTGAFVGAGGTTSAYWKFPAPIQYTNGLVVVPNTVIVNGAMWTFIYRPLQASE